MHGVFLDIKSGVVLHMFFITLDVRDTLSTFLQDRDLQITATAALVTTTASLCSGKKLACHDHVQFERDLHSGSWLHLVWDTFICFKSK